MVRSLEFIRPEGIPYMLLNFQFYFENENSRWLNISHSAGMQLVYYKSRICYAFPENEFYELLLLQNTEQLHEEKYNWLLMKGVFEGIPKISAILVLENEALFHQAHPEKSINGQHLMLYRMPEVENDIIISNGGSATDFCHFFCNDIEIGPNGTALLHLFYLNTYQSIDDILDLWFDEDHQPKSKA